MMTVTKSTFIFGNEITGLMNSSNVKTYETHIKLIFKLKLPMLFGLSIPQFFCFPFLVKAIGAVNLSESIVWFTNSFY